MLSDCLLPITAFEKWPIRLYKYFDTLAIYFIYYDNVIIFTMESIHDFDICTYWCTHIEYITEVRIAVRFDWAFFEDLESIYGCNHLRFLPRPLLDTAFGQNAPGTEFN